MGKKDKAKDGTIGAKGAIAAGSAAGAALAGAIGGIIKLLGGGK